MILFRFNSLVRFRRLVAAVCILAGTALALGQTALYVPNGSSGIGTSSTGNVGIGTSSPNAKLQVVDATASSGYMSSWTRNSKTLDFYTGSMVDVQIGTSGNHSLGFYTYNYDPLLTLTANQRVGIGTTNPTHKLAVNGTIKAKEVIVETTGWSDYVFAEDYRLAPLAEVEAHIREKGHLPGIPSAAEVEEGGVSLGEMQAKLLAKVEELTLHLIRIERENAGLRREVDALKLHSQP
jgi:hypothetical protein